MTETDALAPTLADTLAPMLAQIARVADLPDHQARMDRPLVSYRLVAPAGRSPAPAPAFMFGPSDAELTRQIFGQVETPEIGVTSIADAAVAPTGIGVCQDVAFSAASLNQPRDHVTTIVARLNEVRPPCRVVPAPLVPLFGPAEDDDGHVLIDYLPRLWLLEQAGYRVETLHFLVPDPLGPLLEEALHLIGIPESRLVRYAHWRETIRTELLLLPSILRRHERLSPSFGAASRFWPDGVGRARRAGGDNISVRGPAGGPMLRNRERIEDLAERHGYRVAPVEGLGFAERAALFGGAGRIVGPYSTALHLSVFSAPGTTLCALRGTHRVPGTLQSGVCAALGQSVGYVFGAQDAAGFNVDETDVQRALALLELPP